MGRLQLISVNTEFIVNISRFINIELRFGRIYEVYVNLRAMLLYKNVQRFCFLWAKYKIIENFEIFNKFFRTLTRLIRFFTNL